MAPSFGLHQLGLQHRGVCGGRTVDRVVACLHEIDTPVGVVTPQACHRAGGSMLTLKLVKFCQGSINADHACCDFEAPVAVSLCLSFAIELQGSHQGRQRGALTDQRNDDDAERDDQDQITLGELGIAERLWYRECRHQRDATP